VASADRDTIYKIPGDLYINPSDLTSSFGTLLGAVRGVHLRPNQEAHELGAPEWADEPAEVLLGRQRWVFGCNLRAWDHDAVSTLFPNVSGSSGSTVIDHPGTNRAGYKLTSSSVVLLFKALKSSHPSVIVYNALPMIDEAAQLSFMVSDEFAFPALFLATRGHASGKSVAVGLLANLSLT